MTIQNNDHLVYKVEEARKLLRISRGSMYDAIHSGQIPSIRVGRRILIPRIALERLLGSNLSVRDGQEHQENINSP